MVEQHIEFESEEKTQPLPYLPLALEAAAYRAELAALGLVEERA